MRTRRIQLDESTATRAVRAKTRPWRAGALRQRAVCCAIVVLAIGSAVVFTPQLATAKTSGPSQSAAAATAAVTQTVEAALAARSWSSVAPKISYGFYPDAATGKVAVLMDAPSGYASRAIRDLHARFGNEVLVTSGTLRDDALRLGDINPHWGGAGIGVPGGATTVAAASNGVNVNTFRGTTVALGLNVTVNVNTFTGAQSLSVRSVAGFPVMGTIYVETDGGTSPATLTYNGITTVPCCSFDNVMRTGGTGTLKNGNAVNNGTVNVVSTAGVPTSGVIVVVPTTPAAGCGGIAPVAGFLSYLGRTPTRVTGVRNSSAAGCVRTGDAVFHYDCTAGFAIVLSNGHRRMVTAGHCFAGNPANQQWRSGGVNYGIAQPLLGNWPTRDLGVLVANPTERYSNTIHTGGRFNSAPAFRTVTGERVAHYLDTDICMSGTTSGNHCNFVIIVAGAAATICFAGLPGCTRFLDVAQTTPGTNPTCMGGDSGAPWYYPEAGNKAKVAGIHNGGFVADDGDTVRLCFFTPTHWVLNTYGPGAAVLTVL